MGLLDALEAQAPGTAYAEADLVRRVVREAREDRGRLLAAGALGLLVGLANERGRAHDCTPVTRIHLV